MKAFYSLIVAAALLGAILVTPAGLAAQVSRIDPGDWGIGAILGEPTAVNIKYWVMWNTAFDFGAGWAWGGKGYFTGYFDYIWHNFDFFEKIGSGDLPVYFGVGGRFVIEGDDVRLGLRIPIGVEYIMYNRPLSFFVEIVPIFDFTPDTGGTLNGGIGFRYMFR